VNVAIPGSDTSLSTFTVNGTTVSDGSVVSIASGARRVKVAAITGESSSSVVVTGKAVVEGVNTLTVVVTALNGDSRTYTVTLNVGN
jgi:phage tail sheath gpL-like